MTEEDRKLLTKYLEDDFEYLQKIGMDRNFDNGNDMIVLKDKLVEKKEWHIFFQLVKSYCPYYGQAEVTDWIFVPERFCQLVADYLKENKL